MQNHETKVNSIVAAVTLANKWLKEERYDLFRGQAKNWKLLSSIHRHKTQEQYEKDLERLALFRSFMEITAALKRYIPNVDNLIAIAQHYGMNTNFIDFTSDPKVAAYFATHSIDNDSGENACIICVQSKDFTTRINAIHPALKKYITYDQKPEFLSFDVKNLWRLQAQKGHFLYTPFGGIENIYKFHRIVFPFTGPYNGIQATDILPNEKSILETHLDYFFSGERRSNNLKWITDWLGKENTYHLPVESIFNYINAKCKPHRSWQAKNTSIWRKNVEEHWNDIEKRKPLNISLPYSRIRTKEDLILSAQIEKIIDNHSSCRDRIAQLIVKREGIPFNKKTNILIQRGCNLIWNGMRKLPYTNKEIAFSLSRFVIMMNFHKEWDSSDQFKPLLHRVVKICISGDDGNHSNAFIGGQNILNAKRRGILSHIKNEYRSVCENNPVALTQLIYRPQYLFSFDDFKRLFVSDAIPCQTVLEISAKNPVIYFNPVYIETFGLA